MQPICLYNQWLQLGGKNMLHIMKIMQIPKGCEAVDLKLHQATDSS